MTDLPEELTLRAFARKGQPAYKPKAPRSPDLKVKEGETPSPERVTLELISLGQCRWPYGAIATGDFAFCGRKTIGLKSSWCEYHLKRVYRADGKPYSEEDVTDKEIEIARNLLPTID